jgi:hypothetical protein
MSQTEEILREKARESGMSYSTLQNVYNRGIGAWKTNPASVRLVSGEKNYNPSRAGKMGKERWAMARVNAFIEKRKSVFYGSDNDLRVKAGLR